MLIFYYLAGRSFHEGRTAVYAYSGKPILAVLSALLDAGDYEKMLSIEGK